MGYLAESSAQISQHLLLIVNLKLEVMEMEIRYATLSSEEKQNNTRDEDVSDIHILWTNATLPLLIILLVISAIIQAQGAELFTKLNLQSKYNVSQITDLMSSKIEFITMNIWC